MRIERRCAKCTNTYAPDEAPGDLCPIHQAAEDASRPEIIALALAIACVVLAAVALR
ncbi:hypothetical protein D3C72_718860 [compost metagenome]